MGMALLLGGSAPRFLVQVLTIKPHQAEILATIRRCTESGDSPIGDGQGPQTNGDKTTGVEKKRAPAASTQNSGGKGKKQVIACD